MMLNGARVICIFIFICISTCGVRHAYAQNSVSDTLRSRFNAFRSKNFTEKIFLHTDRSSYFTGEDVWFTIFHVDASFHKPMTWSKVLYVELIGRDGQPVIQGKFPLGDTITTGSFFLPASLNSGNYELVAYTSWMKNFGSEFFFRQRISVINPFLELPKDLDQGPEYDIQFFPEGGNLVYGLESTIGFRAVGRDGHGVNFKGAILNQQNDTLARFSPLKFGLGRFNFLPEQGQQYRVVIVDSRKKIFHPILPAIKVDGFVMQAVDLMTKIKISVRASDKNAGSVFLVIHTRQTQLLIEQQSFKDGEAIFMIDKKRLAEGVSHITLFNDQLIPVCERLWFRKLKHSLQLDVKFNEVSFSTRQKVDLRIQSHSNNSSAALSNLSVVVYKPDSLDLLMDNIVSYLNLTSDLKGHVEHPEYYFGDESIELSEATNNLMLTHGWRRLNWKDVLSGTNEMRYPSELNGHIISGRITDRMSNLPANQIATYLSFPGLPVNVYVSRSDSLGRISFETHPGKGKKNLVVQPEIKDNSSYQIELDDPYFVEHSTQLQHKFSLSLKIKTAIEQRSIHMQVHSLFHSPGYAATLIKNGLPFYGKADEAYLLDDYTRFPTMEEVMREYMPGVRVSKTHGRFQITNMDIVNKRSFRDNPLVLVDGVPVFDMEKVMEIDPLKIKKLDAVTKRYYLQAASFEGIVSMTSYKNDLGGFQPPETALLTSYSCFEPQREFFTPIYQTEKQVSSTVPDSRYVLYRSPDNLAASHNTTNLSFYTSDISGEFKVVVQGITTDGLPGFFSTTFQVK